MAKTQIVPLDFGNLAGLDEGRINRVLGHHLQRLAMDCINRPSDKTKRKVTLEFTVMPVLDPLTEECKTAKVEMKCRSKVPDHQSKPYEMLVNSKGFFFNCDFPDSADQAPLFPGKDEA